MTPPRPLSQIERLAATISESATKLHRISAEKGVPLPSFEENAVFSIPSEALDAQDAILDATAELHDLLLDPMILIREHGGHNNSACLQAIARFNIAAMVPSEGRVGFNDIARQTGLSEDMVSRFLRHAMTMRVFCEPEPGMMLDALQRWPNSSEPSETGFSMASNSSASIYEVLASDAERAARFSNAMKAFSTTSVFYITHLTDNYDWASLGKVEVVDVGGAQGHVALELAKRFENLDIPVQDIYEVVRHAENQLPGEFKNQTRFLAHDLFAPQTLSADVFIFRWVLHNWSDEHCLRILRAQIPSLKPNARIVIQDGCLPAPGTIAHWQEKYIRSDDLTMASVFNPRERTADAWRELLLAADHRFMMNSVTRPRGSALAIMEVIWKEFN
ncbi:hypothetical protein NUW58_g6609 [Xylaria curta]|uniref:Uncharacterized protein n=1 Tax=Xylaria curta TaxID=42375 RepID=A0ACC1NQW9_9PEZI|nr:hypothetical protein NUW58_g6609 [Xylaria curta]